MKALIDADILLYEIGSYTDDENHPLPWPLIKNRADSKILKIMEAAQCSSYHLYLTGENNFRLKEGTILPYKGQKGRKAPKPHHYAKLKEYFLTSKNFEGMRTLSDDWEADDQLAIDQGGWFTDYLILGGNDDHFTRVWCKPDVRPDTVICSRDKDLKMVPGLHYSWASGKQKEQPLGLITPEVGIKTFFLQLITGDMTDNIPGLYLQGKVNAKAALKGLEEPLDLYTKVQKMYEQRFGSYWEMFMHENARLLWMMRHPEDDIRIRLRGLEDDRLERIEQSEEF